jgi:S-adenosylmethionine:diacylglycerol 3-amino-3-carboxypropyl transferase
MALSGEHEVVACDINPVQLAYARHRVQGAPFVPGDAERFLQVARFFMPVVGWRQQLIRKFLALSDTAKQLAFWREYFDTFAFRAGVDVFMSPSVLRVAYSPQLLACLPAKFGGVVRKRLRRGFSRHANATNPYASEMLTGTAPEIWKPTAANIQFVLADAASYLETCAAGSFSGFTLSNILDGAGQPYSDRLRRAVQHAAAPGALVVLRSFGEPQREPFRNLAGEDRSMLWGVVKVISAEQW